MIKKKILILLMFFLFITLLLIIPKKSYAQEQYYYIGNVNEEIDVSLDNVYHYKVTMDVNIIKNVGELPYSIKTGKDHYNKKDTDAEFVISDIKCSNKYTLNSNYLYTTIYINTSNLPKDKSSTITLEYNLKLKKDYYNRQVEKFFYLPIYNRDRKQFNLYNKDA